MTDHVERDRTRVVQMIETKINPGVAAVVGGTFQGVFEPTSEPDADPASTNDVCFAVWEMDQKLEEPNLDESVYYREGVLAFAFWRQKQAPGELFTNFVSFIRQIADVEATESFMLLSPGENAADTSTPGWREGWYGKVYTFRYVAHD